MNIQRWIARRQPNWTRLALLLGRIEKKGLSSLNASEIREFGSLYRSVSGDLARAKTYQVGSIVIQDLQGLTSRGYTQIYQGSRHQDWHASLWFYLWGFPQVVQDTFVYSAIATIIFLLGALIAWWLAWQDPVFLSILVPQHLIETVRDRGQLWMGSIVGTEPLASTNIMINNLSVSFRVVAGGISGGLLTIYMLFFNGLLMGGVGSLVSQNHLSFPFWAFVFPHGALELPAIFLAGGAGLMLAKALLFPSPYRRPDALKFYGAKAAQLVFGIVPMLIIAGCIEGFFSPNPGVPNMLKYFTGMALFLLLIMYCMRKQNID